MKLFIAMTPYVPAEEKELVNDYSSPSSERFLAAYEEEVIGLHLLPPRRPHSQHPVIPTDFLLRANSLLEAIWV